jgi:HD-like signal output (HDOD) protein
VNPSALTPPPATAAEPDFDALPPSEPLQRCIERHIREGKVALPVMPHVALEVRRLVAAGAGVPALVTAIEKEPAIAAALVKYANSAAYTGLREVKDLNQVVLRLGMISVQQAVLALSTRNLFDTKGEYADLFRRIWAHSVVTGLAARRLAARVHVPGETAFLAGLLHDIGKIIVLQTITGLKRSDARFALDEATVHEFVDALHCGVGDMLFESWNIPADLRQVLRRHHDPVLVAPGDMLVAVVQVADLMAAKLGISLHPDPDVSLIGTPASSMLRLDDIKVANLLVDLEDDIQGTNGLF